MKLTEEQWNRAYGAMLGAACGDALGVPYEFRKALTEQQTPRMVGGGLGPYAPGEWSDDTQMASVILTVAARYRLLSRAGRDAVANGFWDWRQRGASDIGSQTSAVLGAFARQYAVHGESTPRWQRVVMRPFGGARVPAGAIMTGVAAGHHKRTGRSGGNGSLMRTAPVALAYLGSREKCAEAARRMSALTHYDPMAGDLCVIWCEAIRVAILTGKYNVFGGLDLIPAERQPAVRSILGQATANEAGKFSRNGYVVTALQVAVASVQHSFTAKGGKRDRLTDALYTAIRVGDDTDTTAAITGALAGALHGENAIPAEWRMLVSGWTPEGRIDAGGLRALVRKVIDRA